MSVHKYIVYILLFLCSFIATLADAKEIKKQNEVDEFEGRIIDSLIIDNRNIYDITQKKYDNFLFKTANRIHFTTQKKIIHRDILIHQGEPYSQKLADETARILRQRFVLYDAWIEKEVIEGNKFLVRVVTIDRWSLGIGFELSREGNQNNLKAGVTEKNFLGQNRYLSYHYITKTNEPSYSEFSALDRRVFGKEFQAEVSIRTNPRDKYVSFAFARPFYNLNQRFGFSLITVNKKGRIDYYTDEIITSQLYYNGNRSEALFAYRVGPYQQKFNYHLKYIYNYETNESSQTLTNTAQDSLYQGFQVGVGYSKYNYKIKQNIDSRNFREDFNAGVEISLEYRKVTTLHDLNLLYNLTSFKIQKNFITRQTLTAIFFNYEDWSNSGQNLRKKTNINLKFYNQTTSQFMLATNFDYLSDKSRQAVDLVTLGGLSGLRGVDKYYLSGDERIVVNTELRTNPFLSILSLNIGGAIFADFANIIESPEQFKISNTEASFGLGLRVSFDRSSKHVLRIDFAYSQAKEMQFSFGTGQYFQVNNHF